MQGKKGDMGSLPKTVDIDCASSSGSTATSHQLCWNNLQSQSEAHLASLMLPPPTDSLIHSRQNWPVSSSVECGGSSSSRPDNSMTEWKLGNGLPSSVGFSNGLVQHPENTPEHANTGDFASGGVDLGFRVDASHLQIQRSNFGWNPPSLSLNGSHNSDNSPIVCPTDQGADVSGNGRVMQEELNGGRVGSSAVRLRRVPCKRKCLEGHIGQSSTNPDPHFLQNMSSGESRAVSASFFPVSGVSLPQQAEPRLQQSPVIQVPGTVSGHLPSYSVQGNVEDLGRNSRLRIISPHPMSFSSAVALQNSIVSSQPAGFTHMNHPADSHSLLVSNGVAAHRPLVVLNAPASAYTRHFSASVFSGNVGSTAHNQASSGRNTRNNLGYPVFATATGSGPPFQNSVIRSAADGNGALPGHAVYSSGSHSIPPALPISQTSHPNMVPLDPIHHAQYLQISGRRLSDEYVRQSLLASSGSTTGGEGSLVSHGRGGPTPARDAMLLTGLVNQGRRRSSSRSSQSTERRAVNPVGVPISRLASFSDDRRRIAELQNFVHTMRRGQGLRLEDIMLLHQSALLRVADLHDRHRDLRLDVDNMSYEELLALEERIGNVSTGLNKETILSRLKQRKLVALSDREGEVEPCCICQEEYSSGEDIGTLDCGHEFHTDCIKQWLTHKNLCPICKTMGLVT